MRRFLVLLFCILAFCAPAATGQWIPDTNGGVSKLLAGTNITLSPSNGIGIVTINATGASAGGSNGQIQYNNAGVLGGFTANGDATINTASGAVTLKNTGTAGTYAFPSSVTTDAQGRVITVVAGSQPLVSAGNLSPLFTTTTPAGALTFSLTNAGANTFFGNNTGAPAGPIYMTAVQAANILPTFTNTQQGVVPTGSGNNASLFLNGAGGWTSPAGGISGSGATSQLTLWNGTSTVTGAGDFLYAHGTAGGTPTSQIILGGDATHEGALQLWNVAGTQATSVVPVSGTSPIITLPGATWIGPTVAFTGATAQATATANIPVRSTAGAESFPAGLLGAANAFTVGSSGIAGTFTINSATAGASTAITMASGGSGSTPFTLPNANASGVLTNNGSGVLSWSAAGTGTIGGSIAAAQVAFGSGANTITGTNSLVYSSGALGSGEFTTLGSGGYVDLRSGASAGASGQVVIAGSFGGTTTTIVSPGGSTTFTLPAVNITECAAAAAVNNAVVLQSTAGARSTSAAAYKPALYGDGADGATTTWTRPDLCATTLAVSSTTGPTTYGRITIACTSTAAFNASTVINLNALGYSGNASPTSATPTMGDNGCGPFPGSGAFSTAASAGGGGSSGQIGGNGSVTGTVGGGSQGGGGGPLGSYDMGSGGGAGVNSAHSAANGGTGGGYGRVLAFGAITTNASATLEANGSAGGANAATTTACPGGGGGGFWFFGSDTSINLAAGSIQAKGGAGGAATGATTGQGGGGGGGGGMVLESPSNTNSVVTATAFAGGAGGAAGTAGAAGQAGTNGTAVLITGKPNGPLLSMLEKGGPRAMKARIDKIVAEHKTWHYNDTGADEITHSLLASAAADSEIEYVCFMGGNADFGFGIYDYGQMNNTHDKIRPRGLRDVA